MPRLAIYLFVAVLAAHGLIHLLGPTVYLRISDLQGLPYKTTLLNGHLDVGVRGIAIFGGLWVLPAVGFVVSALALALGLGSVAAARLRGDVRLARADGSGLERRLRRSGCERGDTRLACAERGAQMTEKTFWESFKVEGESIVDKVKEIVHEGNVRRVVIKQNGRSIAEFPLTAGVVGAVLAPVLAAIGALVALAKDCSIEVERTEAAKPAADKTTAVI